MVLDIVAARGNGETDNTHVCIGVNILVCGHMFGHSCIEPWLVRSGNLRCPICSTVLLTQNCRHRIESYPFTCIEDAYRVPRTIAEGGAVPGHCALFYARHALDNLAHRISSNLKQHACIEDVALIWITCAWGPPIAYAFNLRRPDLLAETSTVYRIWSRLAIQGPSAYLRYMDCEDYIEDIKCRGVEHRLDDSDDEILPRSELTNSSSGEDEENLDKQEESIRSRPRHGWVPTVSELELAVLSRSDATDSALQEISEFCATALREEHMWWTYGRVRQQA
jgi:hypothetical protein